MISINIGIGYHLLLLVAVRLIASNQISPSLFLYSNIEHKCVKRFIYYGSTKDSILVFCLGITTISLADKIGLTVMNGYITQHGQIFLVSMNRQS